MSHINGMFKILKISSIVDLEATDFAGSGSDSGSDTNESDRLERCSLEGPGVVGTGVVGTV